MIKKEISRKQQENILIKSDSYLHESLDSNRQCEKWPTLLPADDPYTDQKETPSLKSA